MAYRYVPSLLDRLIDDEPDEALDPTLDEEGALRMIKLGLRRDLEALLNAKRPHSRWLRTSDMVAQSVVGFGLPDLSTEDFATPAVRDRIRRLIAQAIRDYEPRLRKIDVETDSGPTSTGVRFRISATLMLQNEEEQVSYDARLRPSDREFAVQLAR